MKCRVKKIYFTTLLRPHGSNLNFFFLFNMEIVGWTGSLCPSPLSFLFYCLEKTAIFSIYGRLDLTIISEIWNIFYSKENREKLDFSVVLFRGQRPLLEKRFNSVQITERRISHLGRYQLWKRYPTVPEGHINQHGNVWVEEMILVNLLRTHDTLW